MKPRERSAVRGQRAIWRGSWHMPAHRLLLTAYFSASAAACAPRTSAPPESGRPGRLPTGQLLDPAGVTRPMGQMPLGMALAPDGRHLALLLSGYREQGLQVVDREGAITQTIPQVAAFIGLAFCARWPFALRIGRQPRPHLPIRLDRRQRHPGRFDRARPPQQGRRRHPLPGGARLLSGRSAAVRGRGPRRFARGGGPRHGPGRRARGGGPLSVRRRRGARWEGVRLVLECRFGDGVPPHDGRSPGARRHGRRRVDTPPPWRSTVPAPASSRRRGAPIASP